MSKTKRVYNKDPNKHHLYASQRNIIATQPTPGRTHDFEEPETAYCYHPYKQLCMGSCKLCKDPTVSKRRRLEYHKRLDEEVKEEEEKEGEDDRLG